MQKGDGAAARERTERVYFDNSAIGYFIEQLDYEAILGTRELQASRGRELFVSPVSLWEIMLAQDPQARDLLVFTAQHLFSPRMLATPGELLFRYLADQRQLLLPLSDS